jgi:hypothetical protein
MMSRNYFTKLCLHPSTINEKILIHFHRGNPEIKFLVRKRLDTEENDCIDLFYLDKNAQLKHCIINNFDFLEGNRIVFEKLKALQIIANETIDDVMFSMQAIVDPTNETYQALLRSENSHQFLKPPKKDPSDSTSSEESAYVQFVETHYASKP